MSAIHTVIFLSEVTNGYHIMCSEVICTTYMKEHITILILYCTDNNYNDVN